LSQKRVRSRNLLKRSELRLWGKALSRGWAETALDSFHHVAHTDQQFAGARISKMILPTGL
jgi:hypothetical protein